MPNITLASKGIGRQRITLPVKQQTLRDPSAPARTLGFDLAKGGTLRKAVLIKSDGW